MSIQINGTLPEPSLVKESIFTVSLFYFIAAFFANTDKHQGVVWGGMAVSLLCLLQIVHSIEKFPTTLPRRLLRYSWLVDDTRYRHHLALCCA